jgi:hypothetical protein
MISEKKKAKYYGRRDECFFVLVGNIAMFG